MEYQMLSALIDQRINAALGCITDFPMQERMGDPWLTEDALPVGYTTVVSALRGLGYITSDNICSVVAADTIRDGFWCKARSVERGAPIYKVRAPEKLQDLGIDFVNAYRADIVVERIQLRLSRNEL